MKDEIFFREKGKSNIQAIYTGDSSRNIMSGEGTFDKSTCVYGMEPKLLGKVLMGSRGFIEIAVRRALILLDLDHVSNLFFFSLALLVLSIPRTVFITKT